MKKTAPRRTTRWLLAIAMLVIVLCGLLGTLIQQALALATDQAVYQDSFERFADTSASFVTKDEYPALATALAAYFSDLSESPQITVLKNGAPAPAYGERELIHLSDVKALLNTLRALSRVCVWVSGALALVLFVTLTRFSNKKCFAQAFLLADGMLLLLIAAISLWALVNFDGLFITFHKIAFTNDFWLLNPRTDLLIQLMPTPMFVHLAKRLLDGASLFPWALLGVLAVTVLSVFTLVGARKRAG